MEYRALGRTGYKVSEIGYGAWGIGRGIWVGGDDRESLRALHEAIERGVNFIDTAPIYGAGRSERLVGQLLRERSEEIHVATKVPPKNRRWPAQGSLREVFPREHILESAQRSRRNLKVDTIPLLQLHVWDPSWLQEKEWHETLLELQARRHIAHFGIALNDHQADSGLELVKGGKVDTIQVAYNIFDQSAGERLLPLCGQKRFGVIVRTPFDEGALTGEITPDTDFSRRDWRNFYFRDNRKQVVFDRVERLRKLLGAEANTLPELALKFCLHAQAVSTVIAGMRSRKHVKENVSVSGGAMLSAQSLQLLHEHRWEKNFYAG